MEEEINLNLEEAKDLMEKAVSHTMQSFIKIRAGKAMPNMVDNVLIDYYGSPTPITQVASITSGDARTLLIKPWEKNIISDIERAIINSDLGVNPQNDGEIIRLIVPSLTEERRRDLVKVAKSEAEKGKISVRNARKDINDALKQLQKDGAPEDSIKRAEDQVQQLTDKYNKEIDQLMEKKEKDIMTV